MDLFKDVEEIKPDGEEPLHFYYNREERIAKASPQVQEFYNGGMRPVRGFKVFFLKQNRFIFIALIFFVAIIWIYSAFNKTKSYGTIYGVDCELSAFAYREEIYVSLSMKPNKRSSKNYPVPVEADIFMIDPNNQAGENRLRNYVYGGGEETPLQERFTDFDIIRVDVILTIGDERKELSVAVKR